MKRRTTFDLSTPAGRLLFYKSAIWLRFRRACLRENPWCGPCATDGHVEAAAELHHLAPLAERPDLALDPGNVEGLCKSHHSRETAKELR